LVIQEIAFKLHRSSNPIIMASQELPELTMTLWCNRNRDVLEFATDSDEPEALEELRDSVHILEQKFAQMKLPIKVLRKTTSGRSVQVVAQCYCSTRPQAVPIIVEKHNLLLMQPYFYKRGWGWYRVLAFRQSDARNLFRDLEKSGTVNVMYRGQITESPLRDTFVLSAKSLLGSLTKKQAVALLTALSRGYYDIPKGSSTDEIAHALGLPRTTFEEHLRKAESKALKGMMPLLTFSGTGALGQLGPRTALERPATPQVKRR
jgi:predicted DNA binding protein